MIKLRAKDNDLKKMTLEMEPAKNLLKAHKALSDCYKSQGSIGTFHTPDTEIRIDFTRP